MVAGYRRWIYQGPGIWLLVTGDGCIRDLGYGCWSQETGVSGTWDMVAGHRRWVYHGPEIWMLVSRSGCVMDLGYGFKGVN